MRVAEGILVFNFFLISCLYVISAVSGNSDSSYIVGFICIFFFFCFYKMRFLFLKMFGFDFSLSLNIGLHLFPRKMVSGKKIPRRFFYFLFIIYFYF